MHDLVRKVRLGNLQPPPCCWAEAHCPAQSSVPRQPAVRTADQSQPNSAMKNPKNSIVTAATSSISCWKVTYFCQPPAVRSVPRTCCERLVPQRSRLRSLERAGSCCLFPGLALGAGASLGLPGFLS